MSDFIYIFGPAEYSIEDALWLEDWDYGIEVKVGCCTDPVSTLRSLKRSRPTYLFWVLKFFPDRARNLERELHAFWHPYRREGEFFALPIRDIDWFENYLRPADLHSARFALYSEICEQYQKHFGGEERLALSRWHINYNLSSYEDKLHGTRKTRMKLLKMRLAHRWAAEKLSKNDLFETPKRNSYHYETQT